MSDLAELGLRIRSEEAPVATKRLDELATASGKAEKATDSLGAGSVKANGAIGLLSASVAKTVKGHQDVAKEAGQAGQAFGQMGQQAAGAATQALGLGPILSSIVQGLVPIAASGGVFTAVAAAVALFAYAALEGEKDTTRFANAIRMTGNYAGITTSQYETMVKAVEAGTDRGFGAARSTLVGLISTGQFTSEVIGLMSKNIINLADYTGQTTEQVTADFAKMGDGVAKYAVEFNDKYHMLTLAQIEHIRFLEEQGRTTEAQIALSLAQHDELGRRGPASLGLLERAWRGVGGAISWAWEQLKGFGRDSGTQGQIDGLNKAIEIEQGKLFHSDRFVAGLTAQRDALVQVRDQQTRVSEAQADQARTQQDGIQAAERMRTTWGQMGDNVARARTEIARYRADIEAIRKANPNSASIPSATQQAAAEADITKKYTPDATGAASRAASAAASAAAAAQRRAEALARDMEATRSTTEANYELAAAYGVSDEAAQRATATAEATSKAIKSQGDISAFVAAQLALNASKQAVAGAKALSDLTSQIDLRRGLNAEVAAGTITAEEAKQQMELEARIRPILAAAAVVEGDRKFALLEIVQKLTSAQAEKNAVDRDAQLIADRQAGFNQLATLELERELIGATNTERARALAMLAKEIELRARYGKAFINTADGQSAIKGAGDNAAMGAENASAATAYNLGLTYQLDLLKQIDDQTASIGQGLASAFGEAGRSISDAAAALTGYRVKMEEINEAERNYRKSVGETGVDQRRITMYARDRGAAESEAYGQALSAAKGFFQEGSDGYRALQAAEQVYRAYQFAMSLQSMIMGGQETAFTVGQNAIKAASHGVVAIARALASLPFPFNIAAGVATAAALAAIGVKLFGGSHSSGGSSVGASVSAAQGYNAQDANARTTAAQAIASQVHVVVTADRKGMNAYVADTAAGVAAPMAVGAYRGAVSTSREAIPAEQNQKGSMMLRGGRR